MTLILNIIWLVFFGLAAGLAWLLAAMLMALTIIGLPWASAAFRTAAYVFWPFGRTALGADVVDPGDWEAGAAGGLANLIWIVLAGWWLALAHLGAALALAITVIGLPFAWAHLKLARQAFAPIGRRVHARRDLRLAL